MKHHKELKEHTHLYCKPCVRATEGRDHVYTKIPTLTLILCIEERIQVTEIK